MPQKTLIVMLAIVTCGCSTESPDARLTRVTEQALAEQAAQNQKMSDLEKQVQARSADLDQDRDELERQRQELASARLREPLVANALLSVAALVIAALPLGAVVLLLFHVLRQSPAADLADVLVDELATQRLRLSAPSQHPALTRDGEIPALPAPEKPSEPN